VKYVIAIAFVMSVASCKQATGGHCQVNSDCTGSLTCNQATQSCQGESQSQIDAPFTEAGVPDALPDAPPDAPKDAAPHD